MSICQCLCFDLVFATLRYGCSIDIRYINRICGYCGYKSAHVYHFKVCKFVITITNKKKKKRKKKQSTFREEHKLCKLIFQIFEKKVWQSSSVMNVFGPQRSPMVPVVRQYWSVLYQMPSATVASANVQQPDTMTTCSVLKVCAIYSPEKKVENRKHLYLFIKEFPVVNRSSVFRKKKSRNCDNCLFQIFCVQKNLMY